MIGKMLDGVELALGAVCVLCMAGMFVLGVATVVFRFFLESSLAFPDELIRYLFVWVIFLGSAIALRRQMHAAVGIVVEQMPALPKRATLLAATAISGIFFAILVIWGAQLTQRVVPQISPALEVSMVWVYGAVPVGGAFMLLFAAELFIRQLSMPAEELDLGGS